MTKLLIKLFIKDADNTANAAVRSRYGVLSGAVGIACNLLLTIAKFLIGSLTNSIAITADAVNNLSDAGSSAVTLFSFKAANRPADDEHPFGHGRIDNIAALGVAFLILMMGFELVRSSIDKIMHPEALSFSVPALIVLLLSIGVKIWMALFNHQLYGGNDGFHARADPLQIYLPPTRRLYGHHRRPFHLLYRHSDRARHRGQSPRPSARPKAR